jgi:class 3 adenylate cyclase
MPGTLFAFWGFTRGCPEHDIVGQTPNLAARLQAVASPGTLLVCSATQRLAGALFEYRSVGPVKLKGFAEPLIAWRVLGAGTAEGRFEAQRGARLTFSVGRHDEIQSLARCW